MVRCVGFRSVQTALYVERRNAVAIVAIKVGFYCKLKIMVNFNIAINKYKVRVGKGCFVAVEYKRSDKQLGAVIHIVLEKLLNQSGDRETE